MDLRRTIALLFAAASLTLATPAHAQSASPSASPPAFEVATIRPDDPGVGGPIGFLSYPGGRVTEGFATIKHLISDAYDIRDYQITGGPPWINTDRYDVVAVPPDSSPSRTAAQPPIKAEPSPEQRLMLQSLLASRCALKVHSETKDASVYILSLGKGKLQLQAPKDKDADPRGGVMEKSGGIADGEAFGTNVSMAFLAMQLSRSLGRPVLDRTGLTGTYDYHLPPDDPDNHDMTLAIFDAMHRLGLDIKSGTGPVETFVIDHVERPSEN